MRWLLALFALLPGAAFAEVCDKERPRWDGGPVSSLQEVLHQITNPLTALVLMAIAALLCAGRIWASAMATTLGFVYLIVFIEPNPMDDDQYFAFLEGCIGDPFLWYGICAAVVSVAALHTAFLTWRRFA